MNLLSLVNNSIFVTGIFFAGSLISIIYIPIKNIRIRLILTNNWKWLLLFLIVNLIFKFPLNLEFFHGLEYEDSYIYKATARFLFENNDAFYQLGRSYLTNSCIFGDLESCYQTGTYSGHLIGYPFIIAILHLISGYHPNTSNILSLLFSSVAIIPMFIIASLIEEKKGYGLACCFVFITIPIFNVFSSTSLVELTSNFYSCYTLLLYFSYIHLSKEPLNSRISQYIINWILLFFIFGFTILIKRENIILLLILPIITILHIYLSKDEEESKIIKKQLIMMLPIILILILFYLINMDIINTVYAEEQEIGQKPFSLSYILDLGPLFINSLFNLNWYLLYSVFFMLGIVYFNRKSYIIYPFILFLAYLLLYTTHYRSYYYIKFGDVSNFDTTRYIMANISLYSLVSGIGIYYVIKYIFRHLSRSKYFFFATKAICYLLIILVAAMSLKLTYSIREMLIEEENSYRIDPVKNVLKNFPDPETIFITSTPLLFQIYGEPNTQIVDFYTIGTLIPISDINNLIEANNKIIMIENEDDINPADLDRYRVAFNYINSKKRELSYVGNRYKVFRIIN